MKVNQDFRRPRTAAATRLFFAFLLLLASVAFVFAQTSISHKPFGKTTDGQTVELYTLRNRRGMEARITNYGGIVVSLTAPDRNGKLADVVLGYNDLDTYMRPPFPYFGAIIGRY